MVSNVSFTVVELRLCVDQAVKARMLMPVVGPDSVKPKTAEYSPTHLPTLFSARFTWTIAVRLGKKRA